jgi:hypothetical protein
MRARGVGQRGQATIEYAAIVLALAVALGAAGAVAAASGGGVADAVSRQIVRALCIVTGGDCDRELEPCVVSSSTRTRENGLTIAVLRLGSDRTVVREQRSDGTIVVTYTEGDVAGIDAGAGVHVAVGGRAARLSGELGASILARSGDGAVWELRDARQADALVERLRRGRWATAEPRPVARLTERGWSAVAEAAAGSRLRGALGLTAADVRGSRVDTARGRRTFYVRRANDIVATVDAGGAGASAQAGSSEEYAVTVHADGRPIDLAILRHGRFGGSVDLPRAVQPAAGLLAGPTGTEREWVTETHLDLTDPANAAAATAFIAQVRAPRPRLGAAVDVSRRLARRLDRAGVINARTYATDVSASGLDVRAGAGGIRGGLTHLTTEAGTRLLAAATRGRDGSWARRDDCERAAAALRGG